LRFINEQYSTSSLLDELFAIGRQLGYTSQFPSNPDSASITDDHRAFINIGTPSADLIINFWNNPEWSYHHTTQDDIIHISNSSLDVTGKTVEQFMHNNYNNDPNNQYQGNYPWNEDINVIDNETKITIVVVIAFAGVIVVILIVSRGVSKEKNKLNEGNNLLSTS
ncbi:MAG: M28 family peptidase, partial [Candidatus Lokiarchaeota archaeon]|nr:M28 family peptidase [Candidatus Lokiarchaeota archaeon]